MHKNKRKKQRHSEDEDKKKFIPFIHLEVWEKALVDKNYESIRKYLNKFFSQNKQLRKAIDNFEAKGKNQRMLECCYETLSILAQNEDYSNRFFIKEIFKSKNFLKLTEQELMNSVQQNSVSYNRCDIRNQNFINFSKFLESIDLLLEQNFQEKEILEFLKLFSTSEKFQYQQQKIDNLIEKFKQQQNNNLIEEGENQNVQAQQIDEFDRNQKERVIALDSFFSQQKVSEKEVQNSSESQSQIFNQKKNWKNEETNKSSANFIEIKINNSTQQQIQNSQISKNGQRGSADHECDQRWSRHLVQTKITQFAPLSGNGVKEATWQSCGSGSNNGQRVNVIQRNEREQVTKQRQCEQTHGGRQPELSVFNIQNNQQQNIKSQQQFNIFSIPKVYNHSRIQYYDEQDCITYHSCSAEPSIIELNQVDESNAHLTYGGQLMELEKLNYYSAEQFINNHFFILREDFMLGFRKAIASLKKNKFTQIEPVVRENVYLYSNVMFIGVSVTNKGLIHQIELSVIGAVQSKIDWSRTKRLQAGSLLVIADIDFKYIIFSKIIDAPKVASGKIRVSISIIQTSIIIQVNYINALLSSGKKIFAIQNKVIFESFIHYLKGLQILIVWLFHLKIFFQKTKVLLFLLLII